MRGAVVVWMDALEGVGDVQYPILVMLISGWLRRSIEITLRFVKPEVS